MTPPLPPAVVGLGELLWDVFPDGRRPGGAPANVAFQAAQLGCRGTVASRVGDDEDGAELVQFLNEKAVDATDVQRDPEYPTGSVTVHFSQGGQPDYTIHELVAWDFLELTDSLKETMRQAAAVCFGTLAQRNAVSRGTIQEAVSLTSADCLRVYDVNLRQHYYDREWIEVSLGLANVVKLNDEEVRLLESLLGLPKDELSFARELIQRFSVQTVLVTRGAHGCLAVTSEESHDIPGRAVKVADPVGAGDAFTAGFIYSQLNCWSLGMAAEFANRIGGMVASRPGAMPALRNEFEQVIQQYV